MHRTLYSVGDVHGCYDEMIEILTRIESDRAGAPATIVFVGDYIDRGYKSAQVLDHLEKLQKSPPDGVEYILLRGNHEQMFLDALDEEERDSMYLFLTNGGNRTLKSYETTGLDYPIDFIKRLKWYHSIDDIVFVHAGLNPQRELEDQSNSTLIWAREFVDYNGEYLHDRFVVHGHTPVKEVTRHENQLNLDTGCVFDRGNWTAGLLTAAKFVSRREDGRFVNREFDVTYTQVPLAFKYETKKTFDSF